MSVNLLIENSNVKSKIVVITLGNQHELLPGFLASHNVNVVIAGGMGEGARQNLISNGIEIIVHHSNYPIWFEAGRTEYLKKAGMTNTEIKLI